ncbi:MAG TPA: helix-turn-helix domain-containing protein [Phototrophicaceae bacterium]|nr:helix-turn-helix domain-containing protein [Phototrophicaceae bacterium]
MTSYGQFCPVAKAMEILDERWTLLVVREMLAGSRYFNELRRGVPRMSPALLTKRLRTLERAGLVRREGARGRVGYVLTEAGRDLEGVVNALGVWSLRWIGDVGEEDLDPHLLFWDMRRTIPVEAWPRTRTVLAFRFTDLPPREAGWWLVVAGDDVDVCDYDPGYDVTVDVETSLRTLVELWRADTTWERALGSGAVRLTGPSDARRSVPAWLGRMSLADLAHA